MPAAKTYKPLIVWFRRNLRVVDNAALDHACQQAENAILIQRGKISNNLLQLAKAETQNTL